MDADFNKAHQIPNLPINSFPSSSQTLAPDSPSQTLISYGCDNFSPSSTENILNNSPDSSFSFEDNPQNDEIIGIEGSDTVPSTGLSSSVYRWGQSWTSSGEAKPLEDSHWGDIKPKETSSSWSDWLDSPKASGVDTMEVKTNVNDFLNYSPRESATGVDSVEDNCNINEWLNSSSREPAELECKPSVSYYLPGENKLALVGAGLANLGNTCFLNSILQCFMHTVPLLQGLLSLDHKVPCECSSESLCLICALYQLTELSLASTGRIVSPWKFVSNLTYFSSSFLRYQQEDAHEFLQCFLDRLESCCDGLKSLNSVPSESGNFVKQVFGGRLVSKLKCCNCGHCSDTYEPSIDLSLEIEDVDNLLSALESFTKVEKIEDLESQFTCEECKEKVSVEKQLLLDQAPSIASFHLKRFKNDGSFVEKIDKYVEFPLELDMLPYTGCSQDNDEELKYDLYAVVVHIGFTSTSGHYYCFVRTFPDVWYKFDDSKVVRVEEEFVQSQEAYVLFYAKRGTPFFSDFIDTQKQFVDPTVSSTSPKSVLDSLDTHSSCLTVINGHRCDLSEVIGPSEEALTENLIRVEGNKVEYSEAKDDSMMTFRAQVNGDNSSLTRPTYHVASPSVLKENNYECDVDRNLANVTPKTPSRSPSPEIYKEDPPDNVYSIPRGHLKFAEQVTCKREVNKDMEDMGRKQAFLTIKKKIPGARGQQLLDTLSEGSVNKKRSRRMETSTDSDVRNSTARSRPSTGRIVAASSFR